MKALFWGVLAGVGLGWMLLAFDRIHREENGAPWASGLLCVGEGEPASPLADLPVVSSRLRLLPPSPLAQGILKAQGGALSGEAASLAIRLRPKLIELRAEELKPLSSWLRSGRLPEAGSPEVLAGSDTPRIAEVQVAGQTLRIVGILRPVVGMLADCYVLPAHEKLASLFPRESGEVRTVRLISVPEGQMEDRKEVTRLTESFPRDRFTLLNPQVRPDREAFLSYLGGQMLFLLGGTGLLISCYQWLAGRGTSPWIARPLCEIARRPRLLWTLHLGYFGLFLAGSLIAYAVPDLHKAMMNGIQSQIADKGNGVLAVAGRAYASGNVLYAAAVTFLVNFFAGSLAMITVPSFIVPGCGTLLAAFRGTVWGILLGPTDRTLLSAMIPHSGTLLLEGAGYILATFFVVLIPVYLFQAGNDTDKPMAEEELMGSVPLYDSSRPTFGQRFYRALVLNAKGNILVAMVLAVAALFEAVEVIAMAGF